MLQRPQLQQQFNQPTPPSTMSSGNEKGAILAQDPRQQQSTFDLEPNPFEQSFAVKDEKQAQHANPPGQTAQTVATPGGRRHMLPPVAAITSPASLVPTAGVQANLGWDSLRTGPLSSGMLQGPQHQQQLNNGAGEHLQPPGNGSLGAYVSNLRRTGFPINESGLRTGLTPGGSGSMFPTPGPTTAAILGLTADPSIPHSGSDHQKVNATAGVADVHDAHAPNGRYDQSELPVGQRPTNAFGQVPLQQQQQLPPQVQQVPPQMSQPPPPPQHRLQQTQQPPVPATVSSSEQVQAEKEPTSKRRRTNTRNASATPVEKEKPKRNTRKPAKREVSSSPELSDGEMDDDALDEPSKKGGRKSKLTDEEKRKSFLERNRIAALKCRQRKKQWLKDLQQKVEYFQFENEQLNAHVSQMRDQILQLKSIVLQHKACPGMQPEAVALAGSIDVPVPVSQPPVALTTTAPPGAPMMVPVMTAGIEPSAAAAVAGAPPPQGVPQPAGVWAMQQ